MIALIEMLSDVHDKMILSEAAPEEGKGTGVALHEEARGLREKAPELRAPWHEGDPGAVGEQDEGGRGPLQAGGKGDRG